MRTEANGFSLASDRALFPPPDESDGLIDRSVQRFVSLSEVFRSRGMRVLV